MTTPSDGSYIAPTLIKVSGIDALVQEIFGPVLHLATFAGDEINSVIKTINDTGYGLTFGLHNRLSSRASYIARRIKAGNIYISRNQIGAVVGSQPFGRHGLSGTGPKPEVRFIWPDFPRLSGKMHPSHGISSCRQTL